MRTSSEGTHSAWQAGVAVERSDAIRNGTEDAAVGRLLKRSAHGDVVLLEAGGPEGGPVVVKTRWPRSGWSRLRDYGAPSPARQYERAAEFCTLAGVEVPEVLGVVDAGWPAEPCRVVSRAVVGAVPLLEAVREARGSARRRLARALGRFVARLHRAGVYVPDLKHENLLVRVAPDAEPGFIVVDLDRTRRLPGGLSRRRRIRNLVQLHWRLSWESTPRERLLVLGWYVRSLGDGSEGLALLAHDVDRARRRKQRRLLRRRRRSGRLPSERPGISAMIICQNEARRIRPCLESVSWCDEIVVVDGGSEDETVEICRAYTDRVIVHPWPGHRAQKQFALDATTQPWVLNVDSDERVPKELREEIEWTLAHDGAGWDGFQVPRLVRYLGRWWWRGGWYPSRRLRLFRRECTQWGGVDPHEKAVVKGPIGHLDAPLWHLSYEDVTHHLRSIDRLTEVAAKAAPRLARWDRLYLRPPARFLRSWVVGRGFLEGAPGFFIALASALYVHVKYVKADERARAEGEVR